MSKIIIHTLCFLVLGLTVKAQQRKFCKQIGLLNDLIATHHINPKPLNDSLSAQVWQNFIDGIDPNKNYLIKTDLVSFEKDKYALDDYLKDNKCKFIKKYIQVLEERLDETITVLEGFYNTEFNYPESDSLYFDTSRKSGYSQDPADNQSDWLRAMKYETITEAMKRFETKEEFLSNFESIKSEVKAFVIDRSICTINEIKQHQTGFDTYVQEIFLNALSTVYDPHSIYFNSAEKNAFDSAYSSNSLSFGIETDKNEKGQIIIVYVNPNSPAALDNNIEAGDILRSLKFKNKILNTNCLSNQEVVNFLNDDTHEILEFEIEKSRGQIKTVSLKKSIIPMEYNTVDAFIIEKDIKAGYVNLPSFYINTESGDYRGTSLDMGKALYKLFQENIDGLLIDLRQNGGGSMKEAVDLANLFVDGPIAILKQKDDMITVYNNKKASIYNKPLVIIVDSYTASAAELFAGVMQDYQKAVIVGDVTFGKATSQNIFPLDPENEDFGFLKITSEKFYRISGKSHQKDGIMPDISISNIFSGLVDREVDYNYVLTADTLQVSEKIEFKDSLPLSQLKSLSQNRQKNSEMFKKIKTSNEDLKDYVLNKKISFPFIPERVYEDYKSYDKIWKNISTYFQNKELITFNLTKYDQEIENIESKERLEMIKKYASSDPIILESYEILRDLTHLKK